MISALLLSLLTMAAPSVVGPADAAAPPKKEKKVCRTEVATGSIMPHTTCRTQAEWDALSEEQQKMRRPLYGAQIPGASPGP